MTLKICVISDTHNFHGVLKLPLADVLIHCGDATMGGKPSELFPFIEWMGRQPHAVKLFVPGNHDFDVEKNTALYKRVCAEHGVQLLIDEAFVHGGIKFYGSPWVPNLQRWAFYGNSAKLTHQFAQIPDDTDVLITHGPPQGIHDEIPGMLMPSSRLLDDEISNAAGDGLHVGSSALLARTRELPNLKLHCYGHIHEGYGRLDHPGGHTWAPVSNKSPRISVNAAICTENYEPTNKPIVVEV